MVGHQLLKRFAMRHETRVTLHRPMLAYAGFGLFSAENAYDRIELSSTDALEPVLAIFRPQAVVNAIGIVKQRPTATETIPSLEINALLPHRLAVLCREIGARLIHISTDCVFSGRKGGYREEDPSDAEDLYGRTKYLGELHEPNCLTLRTSMVGPELSRKTGLVEWFLAQRGTVRGYRNAIFSGFTTFELARIIEMLLTRFSTASGLYHVSSAPISKFDLLSLIKKRLGLAIEITPYDDFRCDRSLDSRRFQSEFGYRAPAWAEMVDELANQLQGTPR